VNVGRPYSIVLPNWTNQLDFNQGVGHQHTQKRSLYIYSQVVTVRADLSRSNDLSDGVLFKRFGFRISFVATWRFVSGRWRWIQCRKTCYWAPCALIWIRAPEQIFHSDYTYWTLSCASWIQLYYFNIRFVLSYPENRTSQCCLCGALCIRTDVCSVCDVSYAVGLLLKSRPLRAAFFTEKHTCSCKVIPNTSHAPVSGIFHRVGARKENNHVRF
jgi:hypothetical protein